MTADFNNPTVDDRYTEILPQIRDNQQANAVMFNGITVNNIPIDAIQFSGGVFNRWDGASWLVQPVAVAGGGTGATTAADARTNLGVNSQTENDALYLKQTSNLADLSDKSVARTELEVLGIANNLSDVNNAATSFDNIKQDATVSNKGVVEKALDIEMINGDSNVYPDCATVKGWTETQFQQSASVSAPSGTLTSGSVDCRRIGDVVTITGNFSHSSGSSVSSLSGFIPSGFRPSSDVSNVYLALNSRVSVVAISSSGIINIRYFDWAGTDLNQTSTGELTISYVVT